MDPKAISTTILSRVFAFILWAITLVIGLLDIYFGYNIFLSIYAHFSTVAAPATAIGYLLLLILGLLFMAFVIFSTEFHLKHVGKPESWNLFYRSLVIELAIPFLAYFM